MNLNPIYTDPYSPQALKQEWSELCLAIPRLRIREAAATLNVSEAELLATECGSTVTRLNLDWPLIFESLSATGPVMALTRNDFAVHETTGLYTVTDHSDDGCRVESNTVNLQLLTQVIHVAFGVKEASPNGPRFSLQFFAADGSAIHKLYMTAASDLKMYHALIKQLTSADQSQHQAIQSPPRFNRFNIATFNSRRVTQTTTHLHRDTEDFYSGLIKMGIVSPLVETSSSTLTFLRPDLFHPVLNKVAAQDLYITICVRNYGCIQVYQGPIQNIRITGPWFNILDEHFSLHLNTEAVSGFRVNTQSTDGKQVLKTLEIIDANHQMIALILLNAGQETDNVNLWNELIAEEISRGNCLG
ncbi:ChuX/HutX family heme-like substrate-binding protein [Methylicorpusculum sp.]|uniref:ChuX/HutX family heme-like substrate-binding protein n=1 Tax=Methylicorpusculum sp. TaxID=2713644 RepID=UPI00272F913C|nr:ChuX/HutX family heme-like substrate-binding protein [Methylicorpusculum sp.]MDP2177017.1 ChuX/HutX family heme-like substrate-binding protein [Methylicorpusculum sp.]MDP3529474.1 ChuX/HutX family heme-like substrate-binding protein [Methylicorpusculum sp.]MDZ4150312.1 ChuX/HutX family heme-like substrate-binding protein [Methylicorpusculum sp.]